MAEVMTLRSLLLTEGRPVEGHKPWPRIAVSADAWQRAALELARGNATLLGLWGDGQSVHMAVAEEGDAAPLILTLACPEGRFPSVASVHPPALRLERTVADLFGLVPESLPDPRPWLDHNRWGLKHPLGRESPAEPAGTKYEFLPAEGPPMHQVPVGPVHAGIIEPGHFRFTASGETVVRLEERLGYVHKGIERLMAGAPLDGAVKLAGRVSGDSTVAYSLAFARAVEAATGLEVPARAVWLRAVMAELERLANHLGDIGAICNDASFSLMHAHCGALREQVLRAADAGFGHRLMMDRIVPGGVASDLSPDGADKIRALIAHIRRTFPELVDLYDNTTSLQDRTVTTGILKPELARQYGAGGFVGRASGRKVDARRVPGYPPYDDLQFEIPLRQDGDVDARVWIRIEEVNQSLSLLEQCLGRLPAGPVLESRGQSLAATGTREGAALVESFRGDILVWLRLAEDGTIARCHLRDPSWFQWPLLEAAIEGNIVADLPLCNKSFNCSYSGHDL
jgi:Ni,Fe-hydrogenase III large subunit